MSAEIAEKMTVAIALVFGAIFNIYISRASLGGFNPQIRFACKHELKSRFIPD